MLLSIMTDGITNIFTIANVFRIQGNRISLIEIREEISDIMLSNQ